MADIRPFAGIRPERGKAAIVAALPYDVYSREEAAAEVAKNPESFLRIDRAETQFDCSVDTYDERVYRKAQDTLRQWMENGTLLREEQACYYVYELTMEGRVQTGIVACTSVDDYLGNVIKKHENTREEKELDRIRHVDVCNAQTGPIFLAYRSKAEIDRIVEKSKQQEAEYDFVSCDGIRHRVFVIREAEDIAGITRAFADIADIYIADGHHRAASAVKVGLKRREEHPDYDGSEEFNYFLSVLFPDDQLMIMDYNRVVKDLNGLTAESFLREVKARFDVEELAAEADKKPGERGSFSMYLDGHWFACHIRDGMRGGYDPVADLDVSILQEELLAPVLGIGDPKTDARIDFVGGIRGMEELVRRCGEDCAAAFAMYPTQIAELFAVADAGMLMPPKSTWFEPKLRSGLFIHEL